MILIDQNNKDEIISFVPSIKSNLSQWQIINLHLCSDIEEENKKILEKFINSYKEKNGFYFLEKKSRVVVVIQLGVIDNYMILKRELEKNLGNKKSRVLPKKMSEIGLKKIEVSLSSQDILEKSLELYESREDRDKNVVLIVDDDEFIRKSLKNILLNFSEVYEVSNGDDVLSAYKKYNPDVVILDIHISPRNGLDLILEIDDLDPNAFIVMSSADSIKENIFEAVSRGAVGFLAKPPRKKKIVEYLNQCITYREEIR